MSTTPAAAPLEYAKPPAFNPQTAGICPICNERPSSGKTLYGTPVCKKCVYRFANRRQLAYIVDVLLLAAPASFAFGFLTSTLLISDVAAFLLSLAFGLAINAVFMLRDGIDGRSPGKRLCGVQVVDASTGRAISFGQSFKRNWWYLLGSIPFVGGIISFVLVITAVIQMMKGPRIGDRFAGTRVIWSRYADSPVFGGPGLRCRSCGYDLTGNVSGRCPECGTEAVALQA